MNRSRIIEDLVRLPAIFASIEERFANVSAEMNMVDQRNMVPVKFTPGWKAIHEGFTELVLRSRVEANDVSNKISELTDVKMPLLQLPIRQMSVEAKKGALIKYIQSLEPFRSDGVKNSERFLRLRQGVADFKDFLHNYNVLGNGHEEVEESLEGINQLITELVEAPGTTSNISLDASETTFAHDDTAGANSWTDNPRDGMITHGNWTQDPMSHPMPHPNSIDVPRNRQPQGSQFSREWRGEGREEFTNAGEDLTQCDPTFGPHNRQPPASQFAGGRGEGPEEFAYTGEDIAQRDPTFAPRKRQPPASRSAHGRRGEGYEGFAGAGEDLAHPDPTFSPRKRQPPASPFGRENRGDVHDGFTDTGEDPAQPDPTSSGMVNRISAIPRIWHLLFQDCHSLLSMLSSLNNRELDHYVQSMGAAYTRLKRSLESYALAV